MKKSWQVKDLIDLEYFLHEDETKPDNPEKKDRDRDIYLNQIDPVLEKEGVGHSPSGEDLIRLWLESRRNIAKTSQGSKTVFPGEVFEEVYRVVFYALAVIGFASGAGLAFSLLTYHGEKPLNISVYLGIFVVGQLTLILGFLILGFFRRRIKIFNEISISYRIIGLIFTQIAFRMARLLKHFPGETRQHLLAAMGLAKGKQTIYGTAFYWPLFILVQTVGVGFNLGVLVATMLRVMGRDLAFGWQSTIQLSSQAVYDMVRVIAIPWSWFVSAVMAHPTLEQIEGSKIVLKEGIYHLSTQNLVSWWPFLLLSVLCYGFLPRMILLGVGKVAQTRALSHLRLTHSSCEKLVIRMKTPSLTTTGCANGEARAPVMPGNSGDLEKGAGRWEHGKKGQGAVVLVPDDLFEQSPESALSARVGDMFGYVLLKKIKTGMDPETDKRAIEALIEINETSGPLAVLILHEAWQPPIQETRLFIGAVRKALGTQAALIVLLVGKPNAGGIFTAVEDENWTVWEKEIAGMGDPGLWPAKFGGEK